MERQFDLVVIGTGVTSAVASRCREAGWTVAVIDSRPFGGTCALRGCVPKKILVGAAEAVQAARDLAGHGVRADGVTLAWPELMRFKRSMVDPTPRRTEEAWAKIGVEPFHGRARFVGPTTLAIGEDRLVGRRILLAAGAKPAPLPFAGAERLTTSEEFLNLDRLPSRLVFVGGGYISFEFAHVAARAGAEVTILHRASRPLEAFDPDMVDLLLKRTRELGIRVELDTEVRAAAGVERAERRRRPQPGPEISDEPAGHVRLVQHAPRGRDRLRLQGAGRGGDGPRPRRPSPGPSRRRGHQSVRRRDPAGPPGRRAERDPLRVSDVRLGHPLHALGTRKPSRSAACASRLSSVCSVRPRGFPSVQCSAAPSWRASKARRGCSRSNRAASDLTASTSITM